MPNKLQIVNGVLVIALTCSAYRHHRNNVLFEKVAEVNTNLRDQLSHAKFVVEYAGRMLGENGIKLTEFDLIALNNPE